MDIQDAYPVIVTDRLAESRDFYTHYFGFEAVFQSTWFILLNASGERSYSLAFIHPEHPSSPPDPAAHGGNGSFLTLQVEDAASEYERIVGLGLACALPLRDEPWGQRRFGVVDPAGMWVDVVEQTEPEAGWWDAYIPDA